jgi:hypothetical protein
VGVVGALSFESLILILANMIVGGCPIDILLHLDWRQYHATVKDRFAGLQKLQ